MVGIKNWFISSFSLAKKKKNFKRCQFILISRSEKTSEQVQSSIPRAPMTKIELKKLQWEKERGLY